MQKIIYHIHDENCKHASNKLSEIVPYALKHGYKELYFTEHNYVSVKCPYQIRRGTFEEIADLKRRIDLVNKKYEGKLHIYFGYEIEYNKPNRWYFDKIARDPLHEFLIFGNHLYGDIFANIAPLPHTKKDSTKVKNLKEFEECQVAAIETGLFSWIPHPEIFLYSYRKWDKHSISLCKKIINLAKTYKLPLAFNVNFKAPFESKDPWLYPVKQFWQLVAKTNLPVIIESDSHDLHTITVEWLAKAKKLALSYGLKHNLVDKINIKWLPKKPQLFLIEKGLNKYLTPKFVSELSKNQINFIEIDKNTNISKVIVENKAFSHFTVVMATNPTLVNKAKKLPIYLVSNKKCDLTLKEIKKLAYSQFLNCFIKPVKPN